MLIYTLPCQTASHCSSKACCIFCRFENKTRVLAGVSYRSPVSVAEDRTRKNIANRKQNRNKPLLVYFFHEFNLYLYLNPLEGILIAVVKFGSYSVKFFWNCSAGDEGPVIVIFSATCLKSDFWRWFPSVFQPLLQHITSCHVTLFVMQPEYPEKFFFHLPCEARYFRLLSILEAHDIVEHWFAHFYFTFWFPVMLSLHQVALFGPVNMASWCSSLEESCFTPVIFGRLQVLN